MKIKISESEIDEKGLWGKYCDVTGVGYWSQNEYGDRIVTLTEQDAIKIGLIPESEVKDEH